MAKPIDRAETEGYTPIPGMTPEGYKGDETGPAYEPMKKDRSEYEGYDPVVKPMRQMYKGFEMPSGMSLPQRRAYKKAIDQREGETKKAKERREEENVELLMEGIQEDVVGGMKAVGSGLKSAAEGVGDVIKAPFEYRAALATDPKGTMAATKEFGSRVMAGDPEARRQTAEGVSMSMVEPFATAADAELARQDLAEGDYAGAAISGASVLLPFVSAGWLKKALRSDKVPAAAKDKVADLERRVSSGEVTDDMQIRRELAMIEDAHKMDMMQDIMRDPKAREIGQRMNEAKRRLEEISGKTDERGNPMINEERALEIELEDVEAEMRARLKEMFAPGNKGGPGGSGGPRGAGSIKDQADQLIRELDELSFSGMQRSGLDMQPQSVLRKRMDDLRDRIEQAPPEVREEIFRRARMTSQGINPAPFTETIGQLGLVDDIRGGNPLAGKPPSGGPGGVTYKEGTWTKLSEDSGYTMDHELRYEELSARQEAEYERIRDEQGLTFMEIDELDTLPPDLQAELDELDELRDTLDPGRRVSMELRSKTDFIKPAYSPDPGPRFGDPNKLEMLKEAYRRAAMMKQEGDIARNRIRGTRSPGAKGAPDSFPGPEPEGTARAERRGPRRERPKKK